MTATLQEIAERTRHAALLELLEQQQADPETPVDVPSEATNQEQVKSAFRALVVAAFDDESLDIKATLARIKEILKSHEKLVGRIAGDDDADVADEEEAAADAMSEGFLASLGEFRSELSRLREDLARLLRRDSAQQLLEAEGLDARDLAPEQLRLLRAQPDEAAMRTLVESWPPYVRRPRRVAPPRSGAPPVDRYPQSLDEFVAAVK